MKTQVTPPPKKQAFTLVELLFASALALLVLGGVFAALSQHQKAFNKNNKEQELQQNVRTAMMFMQRDLRYAGSGLTMGYQDLDAWFGLASNVNTIPWITSSGNGRDEVIIAGITGEPVATFSAWVDEGGTSLLLTILPSTILPYDPMVGDVLLLQGIEAVMVDEVISNTQVRISRDPLIPNTGVHLIYPTGSEVFQINLIHYWVADVDGVPTLLRDDSRFTYESDADRVIADGIEEFNISRTGDMVDIEIKGRSREAVSGLTDDAIGDSLVRYEMTSTNRLRNTAPYLSIQGWASDILYAAADEDSVEPTATTTPEATAQPTAAPTTAPTAAPTAQSTAQPTAQPTAAPTAVPTAVPTAAPTPTATPDYAGNSGNIKRPKK